MNPLLHLCSLWDCNRAAAWRLGSRSRSSGRFRCFGAFQLAFGAQSQLLPPQLECTLGHRLLGNKTPANARTILAIEADGTLSLDGCHIGRGAILSVGPAARLTVGCHSYITDGSRIFAADSIQIGRNCAISWGVTILDDDGHGFGPPPYSAAVVIEDGVWVGCNVTILKGVTIGAGSVVAAGAVVTRSCPPQSLLAGVPARVIRQEISWRDAGGPGSNNAPRVNPSLTMGTVDTPEFVAELRHGIQAVVPDLNCRGSR